MSPGDLKIFGNNKYYAELKKVSILKLKNNIHLNKEMKIYGCIKNA